MNAPGKTLDDHLIQVAKQRPDIPLSSFADVKCECTMHTSQVFMDYGPRTKKYAPYLHLLGEVRNVRFPDEMKPHLHGVDALTFKDGPGLPVDVFYEFSQDELVSLVQKGYFHDGFKTPDIFEDNDFELPMSCNLAVIEPQFEQDPPVIFVGLNNARNIELNAESSGYELASYFEPVAGLTPVASMESAPDYSGVEQMPDLVYMDESEDLFAHEDGELSEAEPAPVEERAVGQYVADEPVADAAPYDDDMTAEDREMAALVEKYTSISAGVGQRRAESREDVARRLREASGQSEPEQSVVHDAVVPTAEPAAEFVSDSGDDAADKSEAAAKKAVIVAENQDANVDDEKKPRPVPANLDDIAKQAAQDSPVFSGDFGDEI